MRCKDILKLAVTPFGECGLKSILVTIKAVVKSVVEDILNEY